MNSSLNLNNVYIQTNSASEGEGIINYGQLISCCGFSTTIVGNNALSGNGGGIYNLGTVQLQDGVQISRNTATGVGGGVFNADGNSHFTMDGGSIIANDATKGGGLYNRGIATLDSGLTVEENEAVQQGGGLYLEANSLTGGNAITVQNNSAGGAGVGIYQQTGAGWTVTNLTDTDDPGGNPVQGP